jgi:glycosyltransferase 2 family protein
LQDIVTTTNKNKIWRNIATLVVIGLALYLVLPQINALSNSWQVLIKMQLWAVGLAFLAQGISYLGSGYLLKRTLQITGQVISLTRSTLVVLGAASIALVAGGTVGASAAIFRWTSGEKGSKAGATLASILPSLFNSLMLLVFSIFGLAQLILVNDLSRLQLLGFSVTFIFLGLVITLAILASRYRKWASSVIVWIAEHAARVRRKTFDRRKTVKETNKIFLAWDVLWRGKWHLLFLGAFVNVLFDMLTLYLLFIAAGNNITFGMLLAGYALPLLLGRIAFILPGGVGVVETSMVALYTSLGIPNTTAVVVVGAYRLISFWIPSLAGFPVAASLQRTRRR